MGNGYAIMVSPTILGEETDVGFVEIRLCFCVAEWWEHVLVVGSTESMELLLARALAFI